MSKNVKKAFVIGGNAIIISSMLGSPVDSNMLEATNMNNEVDIVIRAGEYPNKCGKRLVGIDENFNINCPIRYDKETGYHIQEYDLNYLVSLRIVEYLKEKGVNVVLQETKDRTEDLNSAGRKAKKLSPKIYFSVHHNSYGKDSTGLFFMTNVGDSQSAKYAKNMSNAMTDNPMLIPIMENRTNVNNYIGEMNQRAGKINILGEFGFALSNPNEAKKCADEKQLDYIAEKIGNELIKILKEMNN